MSYGASRLYIADTFTVREVSPVSDWLSTPAGTGSSSGPSGNGGRATKAALQSCAVAIDHSGNLVIADTLSNTVRVVAAHTGKFYGRSMTAGDIYRVAGGSTTELGNGGPATKAALGQPAGVAVDHSGNLVIADTGYDQVRVVAARTGRFYGRSMTAGDIYAVAGNGEAGSSGDRGLATKAELDSPEGVAVDSAGNLVVADTFNSRVRVVAVRTGRFYGRSMIAGDIYTRAGGGTGGLGDGIPATDADLSLPQGVALDGAGNLVIADSVDNLVRVVAATTGSFYGRPMTAGDIYTVAGSTIPGSPGDGGPATGAYLGRPAGVAVDGAGNLVIADQYNHGVRVVATRTGTFYGQSMTAGDIYTVAGNGTAGFSGDGGTATKATLYTPSDVAVDGAGEPGDRRRDQWQGPGGGGQHRHVLWPVDDRRGHLHRGRERPDRVLRRRRPGH